MAINSKRRAIQYMVYGALPPHTTNVLWMDTSVPDLPVCKIFWNGAWAPVHTDESKEISMLVDAIKDLTETCNAQEQTITELTEEIDTTIKEAVLLGHPARISEYNAEQHSESWFNYHGIEKVDDVWYIRWCILQYNNPQEVYFYKYVYTEGVPTLGAPIYTKEGNVFTQEYVVYNLDWERPQEYAKAQALENAKFAILGSDSTASNTAIAAKIGTPASGQSSTLFGAIGDVALSAQTLQSLADSWAAMVTNKNNYNGYVFLQGVDINSPYDLIRRKADLEYVDDTSLQVYVGGGSVLNSTVLKSVKFREVLRIESGSNDIRGCSLLESIEFPKLYSFSQNNWCITQNPELKKLYMPELYLFSGGTPFPTYGCPKLIDITIGAFSANPNFLSAWDPTIALDSTSSSLVEEGETFTNNLEKLLYNIREHIAARLADMTGIGKTITFSANVKAAINASTETANAFTSKGWTVA